MSPDTITTYLGMIAGGAGAAFAGAAGCSWPGKRMPTIWRPS